MYSLNKCAKMYCKKMKCLAKDARDDPTKNIMAGIRSYFT